MEFACNWLYFNAVLVFLCFLKFPCVLSIFTVVDFKFSIKIFPILQFFQIIVFFLLSSESRNILTKFQMILKGEGHVWKKGYSSMT